MNSLACQSHQYLDQMGHKWYNHEKASLVYLALLVAWEAMLSDHLGSLLLVLESLLSVLESVQELQSVLVLWIVSLS